MRFRNCLRLLMENFKQVFQLLWAKLVVGLVATALTCALVLPELNQIWNSAEMQELIANCKELIGAFFTVDEAKTAGIKAAIFNEGGSLDKVGTLLSSMTSEVVWTVVGISLIYLVRRFVDTVCHFTTGSMLNDKMSTYAETKYVTALVANLGKASVYSLVYVPLVFLFDLVIVAVCALILMALPMLPSLFVGMTAVVLLQAFKLAFTSAWLPAMTTDNKRLRDALRGAKGRERRQRPKSFALYLVSVYFIVIVNVVAAICTIGSALIITLPASYFFLICMQYVNYYTVKGKKYFVTYEHIASNTARGDTEHFFEYLEESAQAEELQDNK